jgi:fibronectin type 3 domain-containing protein
VDITNIPATGKHTLISNWVTGKVATCGSEGYEYKSCTSCGVEVEKRTIAKLPHGDTEVVNIKSATCSVEGYTGDTRCKVCKTVITYGEKIDKLSHTSSDWIIKIRPTTLTDGLRYKKCTVCDIELEREVIPATKHRFDNGVVKIPATCTQDGERIYTCAKCGETKIEVIEATGHKEVVIPAVAPTYSSVGKTEGKKCSVCNEILVAQKDVAKLVLGVPKVTQKNTAKGISLTWGKVDGAESYRVYRRTYDTKTKKYSEWTTLSKAQKGTSFVDTKVKLGTTYSYMVKAINSGVLSKGTPTKNLKYNVTPTVKVVNASKGISVSWSPIANATGYEVYSSTYNAKTKKWSSFTKRATAKENAKSWTDTKAKSGTKYKYTVKALNGKVASAYNKSGVQIVRLAQPTTKIVNASNGIKVSWGKVSGATSYEILRAEYNAKTKKWSTAKKVATAKSSATSWTDTKVKSGVQYRYTVKAVNGKIYSSAKTTSGLMFLTMPKTTVKAVKNGVTVTWTQSTGATSYEVYRAEYNKQTKKYTAFKKVATAKSTAKSYTDKTAKKGVKYKYTVKAVNGKVASAYKEVVVSR